MRDFVCYYDFEVKIVDFYLILQSIMDEQGINIPTVARMCNLSDGTIRSIIVRKQKKVALEVAFKLSEGLNVSLERLNGMPEKQNQTATKTNHPLLQIFSQLNSDGQQKLMDYAQDLATLNKYKKCDTVSDQEIG